MHRACGPAHELQLGHDARGVHERVVLRLGWVARGVRVVRAAVVLARATLTLLALLAWHYWPDTTGGLRDEARVREEREGAAEPPGRLAEARELHVPPRPARKAVRARHHHHARLGSLGGVGRHDAPRDVRTVLGRRGQGDDGAVGHDLFRVRLRFRARARASLSLTLTLTLTLTVTLTLTLFNPSQGATNTPRASQSGEASTAPRAAAKRRGGPGGASCSRTTPDLSRQRAGSDLGATEGRRPRYRGCATGAALRSARSPAPGQASEWQASGPPWPLSPLGRCGRPCRPCSRLAPGLKSFDQESFSWPRSQLRYQEQSLVRWFVEMKRQRAQAAHRARHACAAVSADTDAFAESTQLPSEPPAQSPSPGRVTPQKPDEALRSQASVSIERCARPGRTPWRAWLSCIGVA